MVDYSKMTVFELEQLADELESRLAENIDDAVEEMSIIMELEDIADAISDAEEREWDEEED